MKKITNKIIILILLAGVQTSVVFASGIFPLGIPPYDFLYDKLEKSETTQQKFQIYTVAPYFKEDFKAEQIFLPYLQFQKDKKLNLFFMANESFQSQSLSQPIANETIRAGITGLFGKFFLYTNIILDETIAEDPNYSGKKWHGLAGGVEQSFMAARFQYGDVFIGRFKSFWGIKKSLLLSESNALDGFQYRLKYKKLSLSYRFAKLDQLATDLTTSVFDNRYFAGHRIDMRLHKKLRIGLFESIIFGGVGRTAELSYLNPLLSYHVEQLNSNVNDNSFLGVDFTYYPFQNSKLYGQAMIDDYQIEQSSKGDQEPNQYGLIIGGYFTNIYNSYDLRIEYTKVTNRTYNQGYERNRYTFENKSLGYFDDNNFDKTSLSISRWITSDSKFTLHFSYQRNGEGSILDNWTEPWFESETEYTEKFPFGIVETTKRISGKFQGFLLANFYLDTEVGYENIRNRNNVEQSSLHNQFISISLFTFLTKSI